MEAVAENKNNKVKASAGAKKTSPKAAKEATSAARPKTAFQIWKLENKLKGVCII